MLSRVRVQVKKSVSLKFKNRIRISGFFPPVFLLRNTGIFANQGKYKKNRLKTLVKELKKTDSKPNLIRLKKN
jgi:hypothetical protein